MWKTFLKVLSSIRKINEMKEEKLLILLHSLFIFYRAFLQLARRKDVTNIHV